jgi:hypothetical protein
MPDALFVLRSIKRWREKKGKHESLNERGCKPP